MVGGGTGCGWEAKGWGVVPRRQGLRQSLGIVKGGELSGWGGAGRVVGVWRGLVVWGVCGRFGEEGVSGVGVEWLGAGLGLGAVTGLP